MITILVYVLLVLLAWYVLSGILAGALCAAVGVKPEEYSTRGSDLWASLFLAVPMIGLIALAYAMQWLIRRLHFLGIGPDAHDNPMEYLL